MTTELKQDDFPLDNMPGASHPPASTGEVLFVVAGMLLIAWLFSRAEPKPE